MQTTIGTVGRAFQLAPEAESIDAIRKQLKEEGHFQVDAHLSGAQIKKDLRKAMQSN